MNDAIYLFAFATGAVTGGSIVGFWRAERHPHVRTIDTIEDNEGNLSYKIAIGRARVKRVRLYFWCLEVMRTGESSLTGDLRLPGGVELLGLPDDADVSVASTARGGPCVSKDEALGEALRRVEAMR